MKTDIYKKAGIESFKYFLARSLPAFFSFIGLIVYTKIFSPADYGSYTLVQTYIYFLAIFPSVIIGNSALRFFIPFKQKNELEKYYSAVVFLYLIFTLLALLCIPIFLSIRNLSSLLLKLYILSTIEIIFFGLFTVSLAILLASFKSKEYLLFSVFLSGVKIPIVLLLVYVFHLSVESIILGNIVALMGFIPIVMNNIPQPRRIKFERGIIGYAKELLLYGAPLGILGLSNWALQYANRYVINLYYSPKEVAYYTVALNFSQTLILTILSGVLLQTSPRVIEIFEKETPAKAGRYITMMGWWSIVIGSVLVAFCSTMSKEILYTFTRKEYLFGANLILPLSIAAVLAHLSYIYNKALELEKKTHFTALYYGLSAICSVVLCFLLVPKLNIMGAALSNLLSYALAFLLIYIKGKAFLPLNFPLRSVLWGVGLGALVIFISLGTKVLVSSYIWRIVISGILSVSIVVPFSLRFKHRVFGLDLMHSKE